jgi:hypothetical protein
VCGAAPEGTSVCAGPRCACCWVEERGLAAAACRELRKGVGVRAGVGAGVGVGVGGAHCGCVRR